MSSKTVAGQLLNLKTGEFENAPVIKPEYFHSSFEKERVMLTRRCELLANAPKNVTEFDRHNAELRMAINVSDQVMAEAKEIFAKMPSKSFKKLSQVTLAMRKGQPIHKLELWSEYSDDWAVGCIEPSMYEVNYLAYKVLGKKEKEVTAALKVLAKSKSTNEMAGAVRILRNNGAGALVFNALRVRTTKGEQVKLVKAALGRLVFAGKVTIYDVADSLAATQEIYNYSELKGTEVLIKASKDGNLYSPFTMHVKYMHYEKKVDTDKENTVHHLDDGAGGLQHGVAGEFDEVDYLKNSYLTDSQLRRLTASTVRSREDNFSKLANFSDKATFVDNHCEDWVEDYKSWCLWAFLGQELDKFIEALAPYMSEYTLNALGLGTKRPEREIKTGGKWQAVAMFALSIPYQLRKIEESKDFIYMRQQKQLNAIEKDFFKGGDSLHLEEKTSELLELNETTQREIDALDERYAGLEKAQQIFWGKRRMFSLIQKCVEMSGLDWEPLFLRLKFQEKQWDELLDQTRPEYALARKALDEVRKTTINGKPVEFIYKEFCPNGVDIIRWVEAEIRMPVGHGAKDFNRISEEIEDKLIGKVKALRFELSKVSGLVINGEDTPYDIDQKVEKSTEVDDLLDWDE